MENRTCLLVPFGFDGCDEGSLGALLLLSQLELDVGRLLASCAVDELAALDGDGDQSAELVCGHLDEM